MFFRATPDDVLGLLLDLVLGNWGITLVALGDCSVGGSESSPQACRAYTPASSLSDLHLLHKKEGAQLHTLDLAVFFPTFILPLVLLLPPLLPL